MMAIRQTFRWLLALSLVLSAYALWKGSTRPGVVLPTVSGAELLQNLPEESSPPKEPVTQLPTSLAPLQVEPALRDIFNNPFTPPPKPARAVTPPLPPAPSVQVLSPTSAPVPVAPPVTWRFLGRMKAPDGTTTVMISRGDVVIPVGAGSQLNDGFIVKTVGDEAIRLAHPPTGTEVDIPVPLAQSP